ncbi:MAG: hypothetical protein QXV75_07960 [Candidatus Bathyarchaeia archaeon]
MVTLYCIAELKKPAHVGFGTGKQIRDFRRKPVIPSLTLTTQISALTLRLAKAVNRPAPLVKASDGFVMDNAKIVSVRGQEFFTGKISFTVQVQEKDLDLVLGALKLLQNFGIGANTSMGFGYCSIRVVRTSKGKPETLIQEFNPKAADLAGREPFKQPNVLVRFAQTIFNKLKVNWSSWFRAFNPSPFQKLVFLMGETEIQNPFAYRGWLRSRLLEKLPFEHKDNLTVCPPKANPCKVCRLMGRMAEKSRVIVRIFPKKGEGKSIVYVLVDNPTEEELKALQEVAGLKVVHEEGVGEFLPIKDGKNLREKVERKNL